MTESESCGIVIEMLSLRKPRHKKALFQASYADKEEETLRKEPKKLRQTIKKSLV
ncbi:hypothetical protein EXN66_Car000010 [Channa argus]|uniref:Uncharacterized protein n=1 Tax=Channa argus TaxID=215402 RepID=A0A6G1QVX6_CHAAH|nr:hypothetical protein EXN66_Car000010 [Channa argus]